MNKLILAVILLTLIGCEKSEGEGGNSSISGKVNLEFWNNTFTVMQYEAAAAEYDVYIVYGDDFSFSDKTTTDFEGDYEFKYLRPGDYSVYVYSKVNSSDAINGQAPDDEALIQNITLDKKEDSVLPDFTVLDN